MNQPTLAQGRGGVLIRYIGRKEKKTDNVCGTEIVWEGFGDVQEVPLPVAQKLLIPKYRNVWQLASEEAPSEDHLAKQSAANLIKAVQTHVAKQATKPAVPKEIEVRVPIEEIIDTICTLMEEPEAQAKHLSEDGKKIKLESVREKLGKRVGQKQLDEAWSIINSSGS